MNRLALRRYLRALLVFLCLPYLGVCALIYSQQKALLYPVDSASGLPDLRVLPGWQAFTGDGRAYWREAVGQAKATVVVFHGNGGSAMDRRFYADALNPLGYRVVLAEYPGYGGRSGEPAEAALVDDARGLVQAVGRRFPEPVVVWGESLGAGVAAAAVAEPLAGVRALVLLTPWNSLADAAGGHYPYLPVRWLLRDRYDSISNLQAFSGRVAVLVADEDRLIPPALGLALYESYGGAKRLWRFPGAGHNDWPAEAQQAWWAEVMHFALAESGRQ